MRKVLHGYDLTMNMVMEAEEVTVVGERIHLSYILYLILTKFKLRKTAHLVMYYDEYGKFFKWIQCYLFRNITAIYLIVVYHATGLQGRKKDRHKYSVIFGLGAKKFRTQVSA